MNKNERETRNVYIQILGAVLLALGFFYVCYWSLPTEGGAEFIASLTSPFSIYRLSISNTSFSNIFQFTVHVSTLSFFNEIN